MPHEPLNLDWREHVTNPEDQQALQELEQAGVTLEWRQEEHAATLEDGTENELAHELDRAVTTNAAFVAVRGGQQLARETDLGAGSIGEAVRRVIRAAHRQL